MRLLGWQWPLVIVFVLYVLTSAAVLAGRLRYERRRRLLGEIHKAATGGGDAERMLERAGASRVQRLAFEARSSHAVDEVVARFLLKTVGGVRITDVAMGRRAGTSRWRRIAALRVLALAAPEEALPALVDAAHASDEEVIAAAVRILGGMASERAAAALVSTLREGRYSRSRVATFLDRFSLDIPGVLEPLLSDGAAVNRFWGAVLMHRYASSEWVEQLVVRASGDLAGPVRKAAIQSLAASGTKTAIRVAAMALDDKIWYVRAHAARALGMLGAVEHAPAVAALLAERRWWVREAAADALVQMGERAEAAVIACLSHEDRFARNRAAEVLQNMGTVERLLVAEAVTPGDAGRREVLLKIRDAGGPSLAHAVLGGMPEDLRIRARAALRTMGTAAGT